MNRPSPTPDRFLTLVALTAALAVSGCALPRIDPTGERFLIWPDNQTIVGPVATPGLATPGLAQPSLGLATGGIAPAPGNPTAPPVLSSGQVASSDRNCPLCPLNPLLGLGRDRTVIGPVAEAPPEPPSDRVRLTPSRVLAPVGTEVVLRAGVCGKDGYLLTNRKIEWMLGQEGAGQFAVVGEEGEMDMGRLPWSRPRKVDSHFAIGYTAPFYTCLRRGTVNVSDDLQVQKGEAWITVTSASEGASHVTAFAPTVENWNTRRAQATIYWVDAQWRLSPSAMVATGQPHRLTTTVTRQTDGAPIAGWIVRYEVADASGAQLGYEAGQVSEVTTDNQGQASVDVAPNNQSPGTTRVRITIVRPAQAGAGGSPRLDIGSGETQITWSDSAAGTQPLLPPVEPPPADAGVPGNFPTIPSNEPPPQIDQTPAGRPDLRLSVTRESEGDVKEGDEVGYVVFFKNVGDGIARNVRLEARFDTGLAHPSDPLATGGIKLENLGDFPPNASREIPLKLDVLTAGSHYVDVTLSADGVSDAFQHQEFTALEDRPAIPQVELRTSVSPIRPDVGGEVRFKATIENTGALRAEGLRFFVYADPQLEISQGTEGSQPTQDGGFFFDVEPIEPGAKRVLQYSYTCVRATEVDRPAEIRASVRSESGVNLADARTVEIIPAPPLSVLVTSSADPARLRSRNNLVITLRNNSAQPLNSVTLQVAVPAGLTLQPSLAQTPAGSAFQTEGETLVLNPPIPQILPGQSAQVVLPYDSVQQGDHTVRAQAAWDGAASWTIEDTVIPVRP